jgi:hypothetical protein
VFVVLRLRFALVHAITTYKESGSVAPVIHRRGCPASRSGRIPRIFFFTKRWVGRSTGLEVWEKRKIYCFAGIRAPDLQANRPVTVLIILLRRLYIILLAKLNIFLFDYKFRLSRGANLSFDSLLLGLYSAWVDVSQHVSEERTSSIFRATVCITCKQKDHHLPFSLCFTFKFLLHKLLLV